MQHRRPSRWKLLAVALALSWTPWHSQGAAEAQSLSVNPLTPSVDASPREPITLLFRVTNEGSTLVPFVPRVELPPGWWVVVPPEGTSLAPGEAATVLFSVVSPLGAPAGQHEVTVLLEDPAGDVLGKLSFAFRIRPQVRLEVVALEAPGFVLAGPYQVVFLVRNEGNTGLDLTLSVRENLGYPVTVAPARVGLAAGQAAVVTAHVQVPPTLARRARHQIQLIARSAEPAASAQATGSARVELVPRNLPETLAFHTFPLRLRGGVAATGTETAFNWRISGSGPLTDRDPGQLALWVDGDNQWAAYLRPNLQVAAGRQTFSLSPLTEFGVFATGVDAAARSGPWSWHTYWHGGDPANSTAVNSWAFRVAHRVGAKAELSVNTLARPHLGINLWSLQGRLFRESALGLDTEVEYGWQVGGGTHREPRALRLEASAGVGAASLHGGFRRWDVGYNRAGGAGEGSEQLTLSAWIRLAEGAYLNAGWSEELEFVDEGHEARRNNGALGITVRRGATYWQLRGSAASQLDPERLPEEKRYSLSLSSLRSLARGRQLSHMLEWDWGRDLEETGRSPSISYSLAYSHSYSGGVLDLSGTWEHFLASRSAGRFGLALGWRHGSARHGGQVQLRAQAVWSPESEGALGISLAYELPLDVPLMRRSDVGKLSGRVVDEAGRGVAGLVVQLNDLATTTDRDGNFQFPAVPRGRGFFTLRPEQLAPGLLTLPATPWTVDMVPGRHVEQVFRLVRAARLTGRLEVLPPPGTALEAGALFGAPGSESPPSLAAGLLVELRGDGGTPVQRRLANQEGAFVFDHLLPGRWTLRVYADGLPEGYVLRPAEQQVTLAPGEDASVKIAIVPLPREIRFIEGGSLQPEEVE